MCWIWVLGFNLILISKLSQQRQLSTVSSSTYTAGVVEFNLRLDQTETEKIVKNTERFVHLIKSKDTSNVDILVFPEAVLNSGQSPILLPDSNENRILCDNKEAHPLLRNISCAVRETAKYVVINLYLRINCLSTNGNAQCVNENRTTNVYNSALAFGRNGAVIAIYRKYNLFDEPGVQKPSVPDHTTFTTDFNVTFGIFTCFDLLFNEPGLSLVNAGIQHFITPTMWFSQLPYLTAIQIQQSWAHANNVNLLVAGANRPAVGNSGSGIYAGQLGALKAFIAESAETKVLIANVHRNLPTSLTRTIENESILNVTVDHDPRQNQEPPYPTSELKLLRDHLLNYTIHFLDLEQNIKQKGTVCNNGLCCDYDIEVSNSNDTRSNSKFYAIAVFNGERTHGHKADVTTSHAICSLITCTQANLTESCGLRPQLNDENEAYKEFQFEKLEIKTEIPIGSVLTMANTLTENLFPLQTSEFEYQKVKVEKRKAHVYAFKLSLLKPRYDLLTFAVYARDFSKDVFPGCSNI